MWVTAYTDASFKDGKGTWAIWLKSDEGRVVKGGACPDWVDTSTTAELWAMLEAVRASVLRWPDTTGVLINSDCHSLLRGLWPWSPEFSRDSMKRVQRAIRDLCAQWKLKVRTKHIKGHQAPHDVRAYLNGRVDMIAGKVRERKDDAIF